MIYCSTFEAMLVAGAITDYLVRLDQMFGLCLEEWALYCEVLPRLE